MYKNSLEFINIWHKFTSTWRSVVLPAGTPRFSRRNSVNWATAKFIAALISSGLGVRASDSCQARWTWANH